MSDKDQKKHTVSASGPHREDWKQLGQATGKKFNEKAAGHTNPTVAPGQKGKSKGDKARHTLDLEPSIKDKKQGAAMDRSAAQSLFKQQKGKQFDRTKSKGVGLDI